MAVSKINIPYVPHLVHIETTYACNQECIFCYNPNRSMHIDLNIIDEIVQRVYESWIPHVYLIGGEPSLLGTDKLNEYIELLSTRSSVTIVTNGQVYLDGLSTKLACIGVPIHGVGELHDLHANKPGSFKKAKDSIAKYVARGFDVRCIPVLTKINYMHMSEIIKFAKDMGMESVFVDRYEDGGVGSVRSDELKLSLEQFDIALDQMIEARDKYNIPVGWGTAIPFCLNEKMVTHNMKADCGAGVTFAAINPFGDVRICNQSEQIYGNILSEPFHEIWHKKELDNFRNLKWAKKTICAGCNSICDCMCGCKVDASVPGEYSVDYSVRQNETRPNFVDKIDEIVEKQYPEIECWRKFSLNRYTRLHDQTPEQYLITRYQTILLDDDAAQLLKLIIELNLESEEELFLHSQGSFHRIEINNFVTDLISAGAVDLV